MITKRHLITGAAAVLGAGLTAGQTDAQGKVVRVPITLSKSGMPLVKLRLNGHGPYTFMIDTGASLSMIDDALARKLGFRIEGKTRSLSLKGNDTHNNYAVGEIVLGDSLRVEHWRFAGSDAFGDREYDGLLSANILTHLSCQLDYAASEIRYYVDTPMDLTGFGKLNATYKAEFSGGVEKVYVEINFRDEKLSCCLDTGASGPLYLLSDYVKRHKLWDKYPVFAEREVSGANGRKLKARFVTVPDVQVGGVWIPKMAVALGDPSETDTLRGRDYFHGLLGAPFLRAFTVAFGPQRSLYLKPNGNMKALAPPETLKTTPVSASTSDKPVIPFAYTDSRSILFKVPVEGKPAVSAHLSTRYAHSSIGAELAALLKLKPLPDGFDGSTIAFEGTHISGLTLKNAKNPKQGVMLGLDFLTAYKSHLDFDANNLTMFIGAEPDLTGYQKIPTYRSKDGRLIASGKLIGLDMTYVLDTGTAYGMWLPPQTVKKHNLWDAFPDAQDRLAYTDPTHFVKTRFAGVKGFDMGAFRIDPCPVTLSDPTGAPDPDMDGIDAVIGMGLIRRFNSFFDKDGPNDGHVWLKPNQHIKG